MTYKNVNVHVRFDSKISGTDVQGQMPTDNLATSTDVLSFPRILHTPSVSIQQIPQELSNVTNNIW